MFPLPCYSSFLISLLVANLQMMEYVPGSSAPTIGDRLTVDVHPKRLLLAVSCMPLFSGLHTSLVIRATPMATPTATPIAIAKPMLFITKPSPAPSAAPTVTLVAIAARPLARLLNGGIV
jgi:hypothetical protein